ncbi:hypothetical protein SAMN05428968_1542 [Janthinobacterium sp. YR213]|nr:hypothetical protein SAMN05428968_1542 [Janthinobacterium sp. YR213]
MPENRESSDEVEQINPHMKELAYAESYNFW